MSKRTITRFGVRQATRRTALPLLAAAVMCGASAVVATGAAAATTSTAAYVAVEDAYSVSGATKTATGSWTKLVTGRSGAQSYTTYLKFKVGALAAGTSVSKATLTLTRDVETFPAALRLKKAGSAAWAESALTHRSRPAVGTDIAAAAPAPTAATVTFDLGKNVLAGGVYAFAVTTPVAKLARFRSSEAAAGKPTLRLTVVKATAPTPAPVDPTPAPVDPTPAPVNPTPAPSTPAPTGPCTVDALLVPSCNILWGAAAGGFSETPRDQAMREWEAKSGREGNTVYHTYHRGDEMFPTKAEVAMANEPGKQRLLFINWKVNYGGKWADVAAGRQDARIDKLSAYLKATYQDKFFLTFHHEPENDVNNTPGSGMTAKDFANMFRYTVQRMRANGVGNAVFVVAYMGIEKFYNQPWWNELYPGDDVVDWIGLDAYVASQPGGYHYGTLKDLMNRTTDKTKFPGFYNWHQAHHAGKPLMLSEWGVHEYAADPAQKAKTLSTVLDEMKQFPAIKGMFWFDTAKDQNGSDIRIDSSTGALDEFRRIAADPRFDVTVR
ncbi:hypothetical protein GCM10010124_07940 [Pilimelia terevasa]|uniref:GH26 domain-containing protein n=1 Tax=Pilimelia terevasa TaxID=53372 RepID=A0A8J3BFL5_9ACTN|nr:DNRLRE domain-containing protein [Pilimelia terevasa]GGK17787.1 hypothetical protein GCM10010124_07940 [Pilimelia terevasa]